MKHKSEILKTRRKGRKGKERKRKKGKSCLRLEVRIMCNRMNQSDLCSAVRKGKKTKSSGDS